MNIFTAALLVAVEFIEVHGPDGQVAFVNTHEIASLRQPSTFDLKRHFPKGIKCVIVMTDTKFLGVVETCAELRDQMRDGKANN